MNKEQLEAIKERVAKATPGEWKWYSYSYETWLGSSSGGGVITSKSYDDGDLTVEISDVDAKFIAHARQDVPALIAEVERLRGVISEALEASEKLGCSIERELAENEQLREALKFYADEENYRNISMAKLYSNIAADNGKKARQALGDGDE